jgi:glycerol transport system ATP-binding protein
VKDADLLLLDEPLVNLDYKLREELRVEFRNIFATRRAIIVYATAEPQEALALGGDTVIVDEGRVLQHSDAASVYQRPASVRAAQVFGDPPMNTVAGRLDDESMTLGNDSPVPRPTHLRQLPGASYVFGVRPNHLAMTRRSESDIGIGARVMLAEISGSETSIHLEHNGELWVSRQDGFHALDVGAELEVFIEPHRIHAFDAEGALVAAAAGPGSGLGP